jgi:L-ascorbate metabolism protein UlaG (beta-lactamase superfamily)
MRIRKFGHSCLLVENGDDRLLVDPGSYSRGFEELTGLTAVLLTHQHADHVDAERLGVLLERNPGAQLVSDEETAAKLSLDATTARDGDKLQLGGTSVEVFGEWHAVIHPDIPSVRNVGYLFADRLFHPGDAFTDPGRQVDVLALPASAPWLKASEAIDYLRQIRPRVALPVHEQVLAKPGTGLYYGLYERFSTAQGTEWRVLDDGTPLEL